MVTLQLGEAEPLTVHTEFKKSGKKEKYSYKSSDPGLTSVKLDFEKRTFTISGKNVDLSGLYAPVQVALTTGFFSGTVTVDGIVPLQFMMGVADMLRVDKCIFKLGTKKPSTDSLSVQGAIAVENTDVNIANEDVIVQWGSYSVTIPAVTINQIGTKKAFKYKKPKGSDSSVAAAIFDLEKCTFKVIIKKADIGDQGDIVDFGLQFGSFDESVSVTH